MDRDVDDRRLFRLSDYFDLCRRGHEAADIDTVSQSALLLFRKHARNYRAVGFFDMELRMSQPVRQLTVICHQKQTRRVTIEPSYREYPLRYVLHEIGDRRPSLLVRHRCDDPLRFVEKDIHRFFRCAEEPSVDLHSVIRFDVVSHLFDDDTVDLDVAGLSKLVRLPSRCYSRLCDIFVKSHDLSSKRPQLSAAGTYAMEITS